MNIISPIVLGSGFGDEGKGLFTSFLCSLYHKPMVVRFNGGHQAGHTVVHNGIRHVFSSFGSGTFQGAPTYWSKYCTFYPIAFLNEYRILEKYDLKCKPTVYVNPLCSVTTPYDVWFNQKSEESAPSPHGSVGVGFGTTLQRQEDHYTLFVQDLFYENVLIQKLKNIQYYYKRKSLYKYINIDNGLMEDFLYAVSEIKKLITVCDNQIIDGKQLIFEGAQGILLDQDFGFFPNVTRSNTTSKNAIEILRSRPSMSISPSFASEIFYVTRTYQTRHGNGFMTNEGQELKLVNNENETNRSHEFQGNFRTSPLDPDLLNYAFQCDGNFSNGLKKNLVITCTDQLNIDIDELLGKLNVKFDKVFISKGDSSLDHVFPYNI